MSRRKNCTAVICHSETRGDLDPLGGEGDKMIKIYIFEQLFTSKGLEYAVAVLAMFVFIFFYYVLSTRR